MFNRFSLYVLITIFLSIIFFCACYFLKSDENYISLLEYNDHGEIVTFDDGTVVYYEHPFDDGFQIIYSPEED